LALSCSRERGTKGFSLKKRREEDLEGGIEEKKSGRWLTYSIIAITPVCHQHVPHTRNKTYNNEKSNVNLLSSILTPSTPD
jgi:hypothetical protein